jgi:TldD protein
MEIANLIKNALASGKADYIEIRVERGRSTSVAYIGKELEDVGQRTGLGGNVRALVNGGWGFVCFNDIADLPRYAKQACRQAEMIGGGPEKLAPVPAHAEQVVAKPLEDPAGVSLAEKHDLCKRYNDILLAGSSKIATTNVVYRDSQGTITFANSEGAYIEQRTSSCGIYLGAVAREGADVQYGRHSVGDRRGFQIVRNLDAKCEESVKRAVDLLAARPVKGGPYDVILNQMMSGVFAHEAFGHLSEADFIYENEQLRNLMKIGTRFGVEGLNIVDDPTLPGEAGSYAFDSEGVAGRRSHLLKDGVLAGRLHSRETAAKLNEAPTGNARAISYGFAPIVRMSNTFVLPGESTLDDMLAKTPTGIYAVGFLGGQTNTEMFTFTPEEAYVIENGKLGRKVRDLTLTGNVFETLKNIDMIGNDLIITGGLGGCGKGSQSPLPVSDGGPHIRVRNLVVGSRG